MLNRGETRKLQEFVSATLKEIIAGVKEAQEYARDNGASVNAQMYDTKIQSWLQQTRTIEFDVAVTSTDATQTQAGAGVFVAAVAVGTKGKSDTSSSSVSRIKFSVPLSLSMQAKKGAHKKTI